MSGYVNDEFSTLLGMGVHPHADTRSVKVEVTTVMRPVYLVAFPSFPNSPDGRQVRYLVSKQDVEVILAALKESGFELGDSAKKYVEGIDSTTDSEPEYEL